MDIQASKIELAKLILNIESPELIEKIKKLLIGESDDFWDNMSASEQEEIAYGIQQLEEGKRISIEETLRKISWKSIKYFNLTLRRRNC